MKKKGIYSLALTLTLYHLSTSYSSRTSALHCIMCASTSGLIHIKLILILALNKLLISALNKVRMCLYRPIIFVMEDIPYVRAWICTDDTRTSH